MTGPRFESWANADHAPARQPRPLLMIAGLILVAALVSVVWLCTTVTLP